MAQPFDKKNVPDSLDNGSVQQAKGKPLPKSKKRGLTDRAFSICCWDPTIRPD